MRCLLSTGKHVQWRIQNLQTGGAKVERHRHEYRGAEGAEGGGVWEGGSAPSPENFLTLDLKMSTSSAF